MPRTLRAPGCQCFRKIGLLNWKNLLLRKRHYIVTTLEILLPTFIAVINVVGKGDTSDHLGITHSNMNYYNNPNNYDNQPNSGNGHRLQYSNNVVRGCESNIISHPILILGFIFIVPAIMRGIVSERQSGIKELMKLSGIPNWMHWFAWMINSMITLTITVTIVVGLMFVNINKGATMHYSEFLLWWIVFLLYMLSCVSFLFFISSFFQKPTLAITLGIILWIMFFIACLVINVLEKKNVLKLNLTGKMLISLFPNLGLNWALTIMCNFEHQGIGAKFSNLNKHLPKDKYDYSTEPEPGDEFTLGHVMIMLLVDSVMYFILALYFEAVLPSEHGVRKPFYFFLRPLNPFYWRKRRVNNISQGSDIGEGIGAFEAEPIGLNIGVEIKNMKKNFGGNKKAVQGVSIKMYEGEIFALLGHNGAGKTTTISCCIGMTAPSSGTAIINGYDIRKDMNQVRRNIGLCPQTNLMFNELTVSQQLRFFARIKGLTSNEAQVDCTEMLRKLQLSEKANVLAKKLSGGQKRKLCLGISLIGRAKVVFLDEPTSGMDVEARRAIWDILLQERDNRTIILTTHFMEEADVLGDRIGIMAEGKVQCCGSSSFLKKYYGTGYTLNLTTVDAKTSNDILKLVKRQLPTAVLKETPSNNSPCEWSIGIPSETCSTSLFPAMFRDLQNNMAKLGIINIGLALTTMDEVFIKVGEMLHKGQDYVPSISSDLNESSDQLLNPSSAPDSSTFSNNTKDEDANDEEDTNKQKPDETTESIDGPPIIPIPDTTEDSTTYTTYTNIDPDKQKTERLVGIKLVFRQFTGLVIKRCSYTLKKWTLFISQMALPILMIIIPIVIHRITANEILKNVVKSEEYYSGKYDKQGIISRESKLNFVYKEQFRDTIYGYRLLKGLEFVFVITFGVCSSIGLALLAASYIVAPIEEKLCNGKQLQLMTGVNPLVYWGASFIWDCFVMVIVIIIMTICLPIFETYWVFTSNGGWGVFILILLIYGFAVIPFSYLFGLCAKTVSGGFSLVAMIHIATGLLIPLIVYIIEFLTSNVSTIFRMFIRIFPTFGVSSSLYRFVEISLQNSECNYFPEKIIKHLCDIEKINRRCCSNCKDFPGIECFESIPYLSWTYKKFDRFKNVFVEYPGIGQELLYLFLFGIFFHVLLILIEYGIIQRLTGKIFEKKNAPFLNNPDDEDVLMEAERVNELLMTRHINEDALVISRFCKSYGTFAAVSNLSFGVHHGECFGLLGVNGAGKTTAFRMLTGDETPDCGNAYSMNCSLDKERKRFLGNMGYCPQFDGLIDVLSGYEMVALFGRLRGVKYISRETNKWLQRVGLTESAKVQCKKYSGGMKRRLSTAMAMIGDPEVVLLDEPTSGVDPISRREFWKIISLIKESGRAIILTSHSMDEITACCSRLGIMVNGQMQCMGGVQYLKNKFAQGFALVIKLKPNIPEESVGELSVLQGEILAAYDPCSIKDLHQYTWQFQIYNASLTWDVLFQTMEDICAKFPQVIEEYSIAETTLEEVFLAFARAQYPPREGGGGCCSCSKKS